MTRHIDVLLCALLLAGCGGKVVVDPGEGSETHFMCVVDADCTAYGSQYRCVAQHCEAVQPQPIFDASVERAAPPVESAVPARKPTTIASSVKYASAIAVDATSIYYTTSGSAYVDDAIWSIPKSGGTSTMLAPTRRPTAIAIDATHVYWTSAPSSAGTGIDHSRNTVMKVPKSGGEAATLAADQRAPGGLAVDDSGVYFTNYVDLGTVMMVPKEGGTPMTVASDQHYPSAVALDRTSVYWVNGDGWPRGSGVLKAPKSGGPPTVLATDERGTGGGLAVDGANVYFATSSASVGGFDNGVEYYDVLYYSEVMRVPVEGGTPVQITSGRVDHGFPVTDADGVYWTNGATSDGLRYDTYHDDAGIGMLAAKGGDPITLLAALPFPGAGSLATDSDSVYFTLPAPYAWASPPSDVALMKVDKD